MQHAARTERCSELRILRIVGQFGFFLGIQMIQIAEELIEAVDGRQVVVAVAEVVLAELAGRITKRLEQLGDRRVFLLKTDRGAGHADFRQADADRVLPRDEAGAAGGTTLLRVVVGEETAFVRDAIDIGRWVTHHAVAELADVPNADIVASKDEDIGLFGWICHKLIYPLCVV
jgi:hypothetical protein